MTIIQAGLTVLAIYLVLPTLVNGLAVLRGLSPRRARPREGGDGGELPRIVVLVPAHNEATIISRCLNNLSVQDYPRAALRVVVVADNCTDETSTVSRQAGAEVLERLDPDAPGKGKAIGWAIVELAPDPYDALAIVDADSLVAPGFCRAVSELPDLRRSAFQAYDGLSNEGDTWLTRLAGLLTRIRYDFLLPLKERAGLAVPLTGNGTIIGRELLDSAGWKIETITEGWELYARYTLRGDHCGLASKALVLAQETRDLSSSHSQRSRWTAGRLDVCRRVVRSLLGLSHVSLLQRLDLFSELSSIGPMSRMALCSVGFTATALGPVASKAVLLSMFGLPPAEMVMLCALALRRHPEPGKTLVALLRLPGYAIWRLGVTATAVVRIGRLRWVRTGRHID